MKESSSRAAAAPIPFDVSNDAANSDRRVNPTCKRAIELLGKRPLTLNGLCQAERDAIVITAIADDNGGEHALSVFGDPVWDLTPESDVKNRRASDKTIVWPDDVPEALVNDAKAALYRALRRGGLSGRPWAAAGVAKAGQGAALVMKHFAALGLRSFSEVRALHISDYIADLRRRLVPESVRSRLELMNVLWTYPEELFFPMHENPWAGRTFHAACGCNEADEGPVGRTGKTPLIPRPVQRALFSYCESRLDDADELLRARDAGQIALRNPKIVAIRDSVLYLLQVTSGMRNSESTAITNNCWRTEIRQGVPFHWVRTREFKSTGGKFVDFLVPPEAIRALEILQRHARPMQRRLSDEIDWLQQALARGTDKNGTLENGMTRIAAVKRLNYAREIGDHLFLCWSRAAPDHLGLRSCVDVMSANVCGRQLRQLAIAAGVEWKPANHQCRRTFSFNVANSRLGRMGLVFLKWQLKHASLSWTQLYASNPYQDHALYREFEDEMLEARVELLEGWAQPDAKLSGGAGKKLMRTRATAARDLGQLLRLTAEGVELRSTGHAWCISGTRGCGGQGVYDPAMCAPCSQAIIDKDMATSWQMIHLDNLRLAAIADCGPAVKQKADRAIAHSVTVLQDLGVAMPDEAQSLSYNALRAHDSAIL